MLAPSRAVSAPGDARSVAQLDFARPTRLTREESRALEVAHELFTRRVSSSWGTALRSHVQLEPLGTDELSYDDYIRSMPAPNVVATLGLPPLPGAVVVELNVQLALALVDRLLGGRVAARPAAEEPRRPTDLEGVLLADLLHHAASGIGDTFAGVVEEAVTVSSIGYNPQLVQVAAPSDVVVLLCYRLVVSGDVQAEGLLTVCYPMQTLAPLLETLGQQTVAGPQSTDAGPSAVLLDQLDQTSIELAVALAESTVAARDVARLSVGDVLRLEQRVDQPVRALAGATPLLAGNMGRHGRRLAFQVLRWLTPAAATTVSPPTAHAQRNDP